jgi:eukaryotic-like serine/threonine-protein kinase
VDFESNQWSGVDQPSEAQPPSESMVEQALEGRYTLIRELGRGGFGITYLASDRQLASRKVVIKVLLERRAADAWSVKRFRSEMEALARIDHPGVVTIVDFGNLPDGRPFLVMQYIDGSSLRELTPRNGMPLARVADIIQQTGRALTAAHEAGVCHRDLKPANVMVQTLTGGEDLVKLIDFGIASLQGMGETTGHTVVGTWEYMAPEQFDGKSSPASDVFQLGALAYELVTGITPYRSTTPGALIYQKTKQVRVRPSDLRPELPESAEAAILKALSPTPEDRYLRARDFGDALAAALSGAPRIDSAGSATRTDSQASGTAHWRRLLERKWAVVLAVVGVAALALAGYFYLGGPPSAGSIAVLPFENRTGDSELEYLCEGITDSLTSDLARIPTLRVRARGAVARYGGANGKDALGAGRELGVDHVVRGSVSRSRENVRIEAELMDTRSGTRLWGHTYTTTMSSLSQAQREFLSGMTDYLRLKLSGSLKDRLARQYAVGSDSYHDYLKARFYLNKRTPEGFESARRFFEQAIQKDANYVPAHAGLAYTYALLAMNASVVGDVAPARMLEQAKISAQAALEMDGTLAEAYTSLAYAQMQADYQWAEAERNFRRGIDLNPNSPDAHEFYALELAALGRFDESLREIQSAEELDPNAWPVRAAHANILFWARRPDQALQVVDAIAQLPNAPAAANLGDLKAPNYWSKAMPAEALAAVTRISDTSMSDLRTLLLSTAHARLGHIQEARDLLAAYKARPEKALWHPLAVAHLALGDRTEALRDLEADYARKSAEVLFVNVDPLLDGLRNDERFRALLARMNLNNRLQQ